jgi:hypothetical protein
MRASTIIFCAAMTLAPGCVSQEIAWLVPRASVGFALRTHEGHVATAGFVTLVAPLQRSVRTVRPFRGARASRVHLLGPPAPCRVEAACVWEGRSRSAAFADLVDEEETEGVR